MNKIIKISLIGFLIIQTITLQIHGQGGTSSSDGQNTSEFNKVYWRMGIGLGYPCSLGFGFDALTKVKQGNSNIGLDITLLLAAPIARELPSDFEGLKPRDDVFMISAMLAYEYDWDEESRFGISLGPTYLFVDETQFTESNGWFHNYETEDQKSNTAGLSLRIKMNWSLQKYVGFEMAGHINVNHYSPIIGLEFCFVFGKL